MLRWCICLFIYKIVGNGDRGKALKKGGEGTHENIKTGVTQFFSAYHPWSEKMVISQLLIMPKKEDQI